MPGTVYNPAVISDRGVAPTAVTPAATFEVPNNGLTVLRVVGVTGAANVTIANKSTIDGQAGPDLVNAIGAGNTKYLGPFPRGVYNNANGNIECAINTPANIASIEAIQLAGAL